MKVIGHQGPGVHRQGLRCGHPGHPLDKLLPLGVSLKEPLARAPPRPHLVQHPGGIESGTARQSAVRTITRISLRRPLDLVWNTVHLQACLRRLREDGHPIDDSDPRFLSPLMQRHIGIYGQYRLDVEQYGEAASSNTLSY